MEKTTPSDIATRNMDQLEPIIIKQLERIHTLLGFALEENSRTGEGIKVTKYSADDSSYYETLGITADLLDGRDTLILNLITKVNRT